MVVLGGLGSVSGAVLAAVILSVLPELLRDLEPYRWQLFLALVVGLVLSRPKGRRNVALAVGSAVLVAVFFWVLPKFKPGLLRDLAEYRQILYALLLIGMMLGRPKGLLGVREIWEVFGQKKVAGKPDVGGGAGTAGVV
jgi:ABC-type branched-subunit amino acid transport system permease subunit